MAGGGGSFARGSVEVDAYPATFRSVTLGPKRLSARYVWQIEDQVRFPIEDALRADLSSLFSVLIDGQIILGQTHLGLS